MKSVLYSNILLTIRTTEFISSICFKFCV
jgi:hypothetical protein